MSIEDNARLSHMEWRTPERIRTGRELVDYVNRVGFLPLFANEISFIKII